MQNALHLQIIAAAKEHRTIRKCDDFDLGFIKSQLSELGAVYFTANETGVTIHPDQKSQRMEMRNNVVASGSLKDDYLMIFEFGKK